MKILCVHQGFELYGSDRSFISSVKLLRDNYPNADIDILLPKEGAIITELQALDVSIQIVDLGIVKSKDVKRPLQGLWKTLQKTRQAVRFSKGYDLVYINTVVVVDFILASRFIPSATVVHIREIPSAGLVKFVFSLILLFSKAVLIFNSESTRKAFMLISNKRTYRVLNGVKGFESPQEHFTPKNDALKLLLIGRINTWKGHSLLTESLGLLSERKAQLSVRYVGDVFEGNEDLKHTLVEQIASLDLQDTIQLYPFSQSPQEHYLWSDVVVVPSTKPEPFGRVAIEGMSLGKPVLAANHGGLSEIVDHEKNGLLFKPGDVSDLTTKLHYMLDNRSQLIAMGYDAKKTFHEKFTLDVYAKNFLSIFATLDLEADQ